MPGLAIADILWLTPHGKEMTEGHWQLRTLRCIGMLLNGEALDE